MGKDNISSDNSPCHYEWSFHKPQNIGILPKRSSGNLAPIPNNLAPAPKLKYNEPSQHIPYSGPTLWNPGYHQRSADKFLTLTPLRTNQKSVESSLPVISITPRRGSRELSFFGNDLHKKNHGLDKDFKTDVQNYNQSNEDSDDELQKLSSDEIMDKLGFLPIQTNKKKEQEPIFPDVYALVRSPRQLGKSNTKSFQPERFTNCRKEQRYFNAQSQLRHVINSNTSVSEIGCPKLPPIPGSSSFNNSSRTKSNSLTDKNIQDHGTLFSRQQDALYARIAREPTVINPSPSVGFRYVFPKGENQYSGHQEKEEGLLKPKNNSSSLKSKYHRNQLKDRRSYIRWNVHQSKSKKMTDVDTAGERNDPNGIENGKEDKLRAISEKLQTLQRSNARNNLETSASTKRRIAAHFCDVLGQKTCQRCREFYAKNFQNPAKESVEKVRTSSPLTRENTLTMPTVGLQKVVIRVKDQSGRMEIATEEINKQLF